LASSRVRSLSPAFGSLLSLIVFSVAFSRRFAVSTGGSGIGRTRKNPSIMGVAVPRERRSKNDEVFPANAMLDIVENKNAERPKPETTMPVVVARWGND
jgi:hypothetical protein